MQPKPTRFRLCICRAQTAKATIFTLLVVPYFFQAVLFVSSVFDVFAILFSSCGFHLSRECQPSTMLFSHPASHSHTWELPTVITVLSCAAMCSSRRAVGASLTCLDYEGKEKESVTATFPKSHGIWTGNLPVTKLCLQATAVLFIMKNLPCLQTTA